MTVFVCSVCGKSNADAEIGRLVDENGTRTDLMCIDCSFDFMRKHAEHDEHPASDKIVW